VIEGAAAEMAAYVGRGPRPVEWDGADCGRRIVRQAPPPAATDGADGFYEIATGDTSLDAKIFLRPGMTSARLREVSLHELGHSYGLEHHDGAGIMNPLAGPEWTAEDAAECRALGVCR
jgi:hypothetical protein